MKARKTKTAIIISMNEFFWKKFQSNTNKQNKTERRREKELWTRERERETERGEELGGQLELKYCSIMWCHVMSQWMVGWLVERWMNGWVKQWEDMQKQIKIK